MEFGTCPRAIADVAKDPGQTLTPLKQPTMSFTLFWLRNAGVMSLMLYVFQCFNPAQKTISKSSSYLTTCVHLRHPLFNCAFFVSIRAAQLLGRRDNRSDLPKSEMGVVTPQDPFSLACVSGQSDLESDVPLDPRLSCHQIGGRATDQEIVIHVSNNSEDKG